MPLDRFHFKDLIGAVTRKLRVAEDHFGIHSDVHVIVRDKFGNVKSESFQHNLRTNAGANYWNTQLFSTSPQASARTANRMAITTDAAIAAVTDTTLATEETANGLGRTGQLTVSHSNNATTSTFTNTFTYTGSSSKVIAKVGLFDDTFGNGGNLVLETVLSSTATVNANGDAITITWSINF